MSSVQHLREFISQRLTAAAEEIFGVFERTIVQYEEEMDRQRRLLDVTWKPEVHLDRTGEELQVGTNCDGAQGAGTRTDSRFRVLLCPELLHHFLRKEEEDIPADQQLWNQERKSDLDQEEPDPPRIKEEHEDLCFIQDEEQQDADTSMVTSACQHISKHEAEPNENQLHLGNFSESERQDPVGNCNEDSESTRNSELKPKKRLSRNRRQAGFWGSQEEDQPALTQEMGCFMASGHEDRDPKNNPLIPLSFPAAEIQGQEESWKKGFGTKELKPKERRTRRRTSSNRVVESSFWLTSDHSAGMNWYTSSKLVGFLYPDVTMVHQILLRHGDIWEEEAGIEPTTF
ncbi:hypothetical protein CRENBAI_025283 [Crenichthys baileyi]|uniref:Uncharacterized protein n=1 Tax=Crenichthys baileyi TaxID=28760 RepID=A0AAV9QR91_9TELE